MRKPPSTLTARQRIELVGIEEIADQILEGRTYAEIAKSIGVNVATLHITVQTDPKWSARVRDCLAFSAEAWLDRGLAAVESAMSKSGGIDPSAARAVAQECARRAAIRNPQYRDRAGVDVGGVIDVKVPEMSILELARRAAYLLQRGRDMADDAVTVKATQIARSP